LQATQFQRKLKNSKKAWQLPGNCLLRILLIFQKKKKKQTNKENSAESIMASHWISRIPW
jgi:hypothetical protein